MKKIIQNLFKKIVEYWAYSVLIFFVLLPFIVYLYSTGVLCKQPVHKTYSIEAETIKLSPHSNLDPKLLIIPDTVTVNEDKKMDVSTIITLLTSLGLILGYVLNPSVNRKLKAIADKITGIDVKNTKDHEVVMTRLSNIEVITGRYMGETTLNMRLNNILIDALKYSNDSHLSSYLNHDVDNYINVVRHFNVIGVVNLTEKDLSVKLKHVMDNNMDAMVKYLGDSFAKSMCRTYNLHITTFKNRILEIRDDKLTNNKDLRFSSYIETFLHDHISFIMHEHYKFKTSD